MGRCRGVLPPVHPFGSPARERIRRAHDAREVQCSCDSHLSSTVIRDVDVSFRVATNSISTDGSQTVRSTRGLQSAHGVSSQRAVCGRGQVYVGSSRADGRASVVAPEVAVTGLQIEPNGILAVRVRIRGNSPTRLSVKVWPPSQPEPDTWALRTTDRTFELLQNGSVGLSASLDPRAKGAPVRLSFDDLS